MSGKEKIKDRIGLARCFDQQIVADVERQVQAWRKHWSNRVRQPEAVQKVVTGSTTQLRFALYNPGPAHGVRLPMIIEQFSWCDVIVIPGTRMRRRRVPKDGKMQEEGVRVQYDTQCGRYVQISWGYAGKDRMAGLIILLSKKRFQESSVVRYYDPPVALAGRWGAIRVKNGDDMDLFIAGCYAYIEGDERHDAFWSHVFTTLAAVWSRTTAIVAGDFNGHLAGGDGPHGPLHPAEETNENGGRLIELCETHGLVPVNTWKAQAEEQGMPWDGTTHIGPGGTRTRVDYFLVPAALLDSCEDVRAQLRSAARLRQGVIKLGAEVFDHIPLTMVVRYRLDVRRGSRPAPRWHYPKLKHAMDDHLARAPFEQDLSDWLGREGEAIRRETSGRGVEQAWQRLMQGVRQLAKHHFSTHKGPRAPWLSQSTWGLMLQRKACVDRIWQAGARGDEPSDQDARMVAELGQRIRWACRADKRERVDQLCEDMEEAGQSRDGKRVWECARAIAGTGLGLRRRVFHPPDEVPITPTEWDEYMRETFQA